MNPKRRWLLAIIALVLAAAGVGLVVPSEDQPRLVILKREDEMAKGWMVFRFQAPKHTSVMMESISTQNSLTGRESRATLLAVHRTSNPIVRFHFSRASAVPALFEVQAGQAKDYHLLLPADEVWRIRCRVATENTGMGSLPIRVWWCWKAKSFAPLREKMHRKPYVVESELITNAVPPAADAMVK